MLEVERLCLEQVIVYIVGRRDTVEAERGEEVVRYGHVRCQKKTAFPEALWICCRCPRRRRALAWSGQRLTEDGGGGGAGVDEGSNALGDR